MIHISNYIVVSARLHGEQAEKFLRVKEALGITTTSDTLRHIIKRYPDPLPTQPAPSLGEKEPELTAEETRQLFEELAK